MNDWPVWHGSDSNFIIPPAAAVQSKHSLDWLLQAVSGQAALGLSVVKVTSPSINTNIIVNHLLILQTIGLSDDKRIFRYWSIQAQTGLYRSKLVYTGQNWSIHVQTGLYRSKLVYTGPNWSILVVKCWSILMDHVDV